MTDTSNNHTKSNTKQDIKHLNATFFNDAAIELDLLEKQLRLEKHFSKRRERDQAFSELAFKALQYCVEQCKTQSGAKYPSYEEVSNYLSSNGQY